MREAAILARATGETPRPRSPLGAVWSGMEALARRLVALEAKPLARDGRDGINGRDGKDGLDGRAGDPGLPGKDGRNGIDGKDGAAGLNGRDGADGLPGADGKDGRDGVDGKDGMPGRDGIDGKDGSPGLSGKDGVDGVNGRDGVGISDARLNDGALMLALTDGRVIEVGRVAGPAGKDGSDADASAVQAKLDDAVQRIVAHAAETTAALAVAQQNIAAVEAELRRAHERLDAAPAPRSLASFVIDADGSLVVIYSDGSKDVVGRVRGEDGADAPAVAEATVGADGALVLRMSDGRAINAGVVKGETGAPGKDAPVVPGPAGRSIVSGRVDGCGHLILAYSDGGTEDVGTVAFKGEPGDPGKDGLDGKDGVGIAGAAIVGTDLEIEYTDGRKVPLGRVVGKDGLPGKSIEGKPGRPGKDGADATAVPVDLGENYAAGIDVKALDRLRVQTVVVNGEHIRVLVME